MLYIYIPPFSAIIIGNYLNALENDSIANAYLPLTFLAAYSIAFAIWISELPPPYMTLKFLTVLIKTHKASCNDLSASSKTCLLLPLKTIVHASFLLHP